MSNNVWFYIVVALCSAVGGAGWWLWRLHCAMEALEARILLHDAEARDRDGALLRAIDTAEERREHRKYEMRRQEMMNNAPPQSTAEERQRMMDMLVRYQGSAEKGDEA